AVLGRAQPVDDVDRRDGAARGYQRMPLERGPAQPEMPDDPPGFVPRDIAPRGRGTRACARRLQVLPAEDLRRGVVGIRRVREPRGQEPAQLGDVVRRQRADLAGHGPPTDRNPPPPPVSLIRRRSGDRFLSQVTLLNFFERDGWLEHGSPRALIEVGHELRVRAEGKDFLIAFIDWY